MKRLFIVIAALALSACTTIQGQPEPTTAQVAQRVCPSLQAVVSVLEIHGAADPALGAELAIAHSAITAVCAGGLPVQISDLQDLITKGLPALINIVETMPIPDSDKQGARIAITLTEAVIVPLVFP